MPPAAPVMIATFPSSRADIRALYGELSRNVNKPSSKSGALFDNTRWIRHRAPHGATRIVCTAPHAAQG
jgi:hypothetical protein